MSTRNQQNYSKVTSQQWSPWWPSCSFFLSVETPLRKLAQDSTWLLFQNLSSIHLLSGSEIHWNGGKSSWLCVLVAVRKDAAFPVSAAFPDQENITTGMTIGRRNIGMAVVQLRPLYWQLLPLLLGACLLHAAPTWQMGLPLFVHLYSPYRETHSIFHPATSLWYFCFICPTSN